MNELQEQYDVLKVDAQLLLIESDAKTAALLQIVRRRAGSPTFEWARRIAMAVLSEEDHKQSQEWVDTLAPMVWQHEYRPSSDLDGSPCAVCRMRPDEHDDFSVPHEVKDD